MVTLTLRVRISFRVRVTLRFRVILTARVLKIRCVREMNAEKLNIILLAREVVK